MRLLRITFSVLALIWMPAFATDYPSLKAPSGSYTLDKTHAHISFTYTHAGMSRPILRWRDFDANLQLDAKNPVNSSVEMVINANSIDTGVDIFDEHLRATKWFDVEAYPQITFKSTQLIRNSENKGILTGDLKIKDITKPITLNVELLHAADHPFYKGVPFIGMVAEATIKRSDWGLGAYAPATSDEVELMISLEFKKSD